MTYREHLDRATQRLVAHGFLKEDASLEARILMEETFQLSFAKLLLRMEEEAPSIPSELFEKRIAQRLNDEPIAYILGEREFMGISFKVNRSTLIPRQDTEILVEEALKRLDTAKGTLRILDLCTGSGCIIVSLWVFLQKKKQQEELVLLGSDISKEALAIASLNAKKAGAKVEFRLGDLFSVVTEEEKFHLITANPPYISGEEMKTLPKDVANYEPHLALYGGDDGLAFYRRIVRDSLEHLLPGGILMMEIGETQGNSVQGLMEEAGFHDVMVIQDYQGLDRVVVGNV